MPDATRDAWFRMRGQDVRATTRDGPALRARVRAAPEELVVKVERTALPEVPRLGRPIITSSHDNDPDGLYTRTLAKSPAGQPKPIVLC